MKRLKLSISGMNCGHCVASVGSALERLRGVNIERVSVGVATVTYDPSRHAPEAIIKAVAGAGYDAHISP